MSVGFEATRRRGASTGRQPRNLSRMSLTLRILRSPLRMQRIDSRAAERDW